MKTWQDNNMTNCTGAVNTKNEIKLQWRIRLGTPYGENKIGLITTKKVLFDSL